MKEKYKKGNEIIVGETILCDFCKMIKFCPTGKDVCSDCWSEQTGMDFNYSYPEMRGFKNLQDTNN